MRVPDIDTPALLIDCEIVLRNLQKMQSYADAAGVSLRPHASLVSARRHRLSMILKF